MTSTQFHIFLEKNDKTQKYLVKNNFYKYTYTNTHISGEERQDSKVFCEEQLLQMSTILTYGKQSKNFTVSRA